MEKIGEVAKRFGISKRTLWYWEEMGILSSKRLENSYRFYDNENVMRIRQIVLLRKLRVPIVDIEQMFILNDINVASDTFNKHLKNLKQEAAVSSSLIAMIEKFIQYISKCKEFEQLFSCLEIPNPVTEPIHEDALQNNLSERMMNMSAKSLDHVRIVRLPAMTVAAYRAESETSPEGDCGDVTFPFVRSNHLHKSDGFRFFGFHPLDAKTSEDNRSCNYEQWVTMPPNFYVPEPFVKKQFEGGLFASVVTPMNEYRERWDALKAWCESNGRFVVYVNENDRFERQYFEEFIDFEAWLNDDMPFGEKQLDLLLPIRLK
jgi:DNA-binding transcriptional MerR regulator